MSLPQDERLKMPRNIRQHVQTCLNMTVFKYYLSNSGITVEPNPQAAAALVVFTVDTCKWLLYYALFALGILCKFI